MCVGFSVTGFGEPSYPILLKDKIKKKHGNDCNVEYSSVGGLSVNALPFLAHDLCPKTGYDILFLEIATSWISLHFDDEELAFSCINSSLSFFQKCAKKIVFLNLYRRDILDDDMVVRAIRRFEKIGYDVIDLKAHYRLKLQVHHTDDTTDGVHPTSVAIDHISECLYDYISIVQYADHPKSITNENFAIYLPQELSFDLIKFDNRHGVVVNACVISLGQNITLFFDEPKYINGVFFIWGPDTAAMDLSINDFIMKVPMYDNMSYYRRIGYHSFPKTLVNRISLSLNPDRSGVVLQREPWESVSEIKCYIIGFSLCY